MPHFHFQVGPCFRGLGKAYIYILYTKVFQRIYIGQTNERGGVIGRLSAHIGSKGTFRLRLQDTGVDLDEVQDLNVFVFLLPEDPRFTSIDRTHREGIEFLTQKKLHGVCGDLTPRARIVSNITYQPSADFAMSQRISEEIVNSFMCVYQK